MFIRLLLLAHLLLVGTMIYGVDLDHPLSLAELLDIALENHPSTKQAWWNARRAAAALGQAKSAYYPSVNFEALAQHGRDFKFINGPDTTYTIVGGDLVLSMILYDFGERNAQVNAAKMSLLAANWQNDWALQRVMIKVLENAYATLHAQEVFKAASISYEETGKLLRFARELNRVGLSPVSDVFTCQANLNQMKIQKMQQKLTLEIQQGKLATSLGLPAQTKIELACLESIECLLNENFSKKIDQLIAQASCQRADLLAKQAQIDEALFQRKMTASSFGPKVFLGGRGGFNRAFHERENGAQYQISLNVEIPLFDGFENVYEKRLALANVNLTREEFSELQLQIALEVLSYSQAVEAARSIIPEADAFLKNSLKAYECVLEKYRVGKERIAEVSYAQQQLAQARVQYSQAQTQWLVSLANLAYSTGTLTTSQESSCEIKP